MVTHTHAHNKTVKIIVKIDVANELNSSGTVLSFQKCRKSGVTHVMAGGA